MNEGITKHVRFKDASSCAVHLNLVQGRVVSVFELRPEVTGAIAVLIRLCEKNETSNLLQAFSFANKLPAGIRLRFSNSRSLLLD